MSNHEYQGVLYATQAYMLDDMADQFVIYDGRASASEVAQTLQASDAELAEEMIRAYGLDAPADENFPEDGGSHMQVNGYTADDLAEAFARLRVRIVEVAS